MINKPYTWIEIDRQAFDHNIKLYKQVIGDNVQLAVVVKSNAYGHGIKEIGTLCQQNKQIGWLCTISLSEALCLREHNITKPILVLGFIDGDPAHAIRHDIDLTIYDLNTAEMLNKLGKQLRKKVNIHIKIDTGMSRFGFFPDEAYTVIKYLQALSHLNLRGIYTHFSTMEDQHFTSQQSQQFETVLQHLQDNGIDIPYKHSSSSGSITTLPINKINLVRLGAGSYGLWHSEIVKQKTQAKYPNFELKPILTWKTKVLYIKKLPAHTYIGYSKGYKTTKETTIAILPIGYAEGYNKRLANQGKVRIKDQYASVIGNICMNITMIDISHIPNITIGDEVIVMGNYPDITIYDFIDKTGRHNPREITTCLHQNIPRIIIAEDIDTISAPNNTHLTKANSIDTHVT